MKDCFTLRIEVPPIDIWLHMSGCDNRLIQSISELKDIIMASKEEFIAQNNALKAQLDEAAATNTKAHAEIVAAVGTLNGTVETLTQKVADLEAIIAAGGGEVDPEIQEAFNGVKESAGAVKTSADALDALNPDSP